MTHEDVLGLPRHSFAWAPGTGLPQASDIDRPGVFLIYQKDDLFSARPVTSLREHLNVMFGWMLRSPRRVLSFESFAFLECADYIEARQKWIWILRNCKPIGQSGRG
jgi:hypothetical protein